MTNNIESRAFGAEVGKVLRLVIHSLYQHKEIFLRELISNASDACDKLRYEALNNPALSRKAELSINVHIDDSKLIISDTGIGMSKQELIDNLGTIASSGTQRFIENLQDKQGNLDLIGQFGVGFYSAFMVADKVTVKSSKAGTDETWVWESDGEKDYTISQSEEQVDGTEITLHMKPSEVEFLESYRLRHIISTYSDHIGFPIFLSTQDEQAALVNQVTALWKKPKEEITEEQYKEFYHHVSHSPDTPWLKLHYTAEGSANYTCLVYIPSIRPFDLFDQNRKGRVKLYSQKVFIAEEIQLLPSYLRFLRGIIDADDLPLNISRETLQHNAGIYKIRKSLVKKVLKLLKQKAEDEQEEYKKFWKTFGEVVKEGLCEGALEEKEELLDICRFVSLNSGENFISFSDYIAKMVEGQSDIYYLNCGDSKNLRSSPQLEGFIKRGIDVLLLTDHVDDFWVNVISQYKNYSLKSINHSSIDLDAIQKLEQPERESEQNSELLSYFKEVLQDRITEVKYSSKLVDSPACLAVPEGGMNIRMEKFLLAQKQLQKNTAKILEINQQHPIITKIAQDVASSNITEMTQMLVDIVFNEACIIAGEDMDNPFGFTKSINTLLAKVI